MKLEVNQLYISTLFYRIQSSNYEFYGSNNAVFYEGKNGPTIFMLYFSKYVTKTRRAKKITTSTINCFVVKISNYPRTVTVSPCPTLMIPSAPSLRIAFLNSTISWRFHIDAGAIAGFAAIIKTNKFIYFITFTNNNTHAFPTGTMQK